MLYQRHNEYESFPVLIKWRKNEFQKFSRAKILKIKKEITGLGVFLYYTTWLARWIKWRACDVGEAKEGLDCDVRDATEGLENELWCK